MLHRLRSNVDSDATRGAGGTNLSAQKKPASFEAGFVERSADYFVGLSV
jgi:hypothetical protein